MCIDAPECTTHFLYSGFVSNGARRHQTSVGEKKVGSSSFFELKDTFGQSPRISAGASLLSLRLFLRSILELWCARTTLTRIGRTFVRSDGPFSLRLITWHSVAFANLARLIGLMTFVLFRKIDEDFGGSTSWNSQPNCRVFFNIAIALLSPFFFGFLLGCSSTCRCVNAHLSPNLHTEFDLYLWHSGGYQKNARWSCAVTFQLLRARRSRWLLKWTATSRSPSSRNFSLIFSNQRLRGRDGHWCRFSHTYSHRVTESIAMLDEVWIHSSVIFA